jgi:hypothetical protein
VILADFCNEAKWDWESLGQVRNDLETIKDQLKIELKANVLLSGDEERELNCKREVSPPSFSC